MIKCLDCIVMAALNPWTYHIFTILLSIVVYIMYMKVKYS